MKSGLICNSKVTSRSVNRQLQRAFSMLELLVVVILVGIVGVVFFNRMLIYQEMAEKSAVDITVMHIRNGLRYRTAEMLLRHQDKEIVSLVGANPMVWLDMPPPNYIGELHNPNWHQIPPGSWYFDVDKGEIFYRIRRTGHFKPGPSGQQRLRFSVTATFRYPSTDRSIVLAEGVNLSSLEPYEWFSRDKSNILP